MALTIEINLYLNVIFIFTLIRVEGNIVYRVNAPLFDSSLNYKFHFKCSEV